MIVEGKVGPQTLGDGAEGKFRQGRTGAQLVHDTHGRYQEAVLRNGVYRIATSGTASAFTGGAGGTPLLGVYNPTGSGKNLVFLAACVMNRTLGSAVLNSSFNIYAGASVANTGTQTQATNALSNAASGSVSYCTANTAMTGSTAIGLALPIASYNWGTSVAQFMTIGWVDLGGLVVAPPGVLVALGQTVAITSTVFDVALVWEEVAA